MSFERRLQDPDGVPRESYVARRLQQPSTPYERTTPFMPVCSGVVTSLSWQSEVELGARLELFTELWSLI